MRKLVASDIDGTLLPRGMSHIPEDFFSLLYELENLGVLFAAASGRQLPSLKILFSEVRDNIFFIAENGALVEYKGETIHEIPMSPTLAREIVADIMRTPGCDPIISTRETVFITQQMDDYFRARENEILYTTTVTDDFFSINEDILKVTACNYDGISDYAKGFHDSWGKFAAVTVSGPMYADFMDKSVSKGNALMKVMDILNLTQDECIVFGDNYNDISMFEKVRYAFAMSDADDDVKQHAGYVTENVTDTLKKIYNI